jgi:2-desacetyl-2-hydroxyethyl bacteriochlorophyllide A dehydrogenase
MVPGHEICGVVEQVGPDILGWSTGDRVAVDPLISCGTCFSCQNGFPHVCTSLKLLGVDQNGGFAQHVVVRADRLYRLPKKISDVAGAMIEPVAVAVHDFRRANLSVGDTVLVVGAGPIGLLLAMVARSAGARAVAVSEISPYRLNMARELGFDARNPEEGGFLERVRADFDGVGPDAVFEATGSPGGYQSAIDCVRVRGKLVQVGIPKGAMTVDLRRINFSEISIVGTRVYEPVDIVTSIALIESGAVAAEALASEHELSECGALVAGLADGTSRSMKAVLRIGG